MCRQGRLFGCQFKMHKSHGWTVAEQWKIPRLQNYRNLAKIIDECAYCKFRELRLDGIQVPSLVLICWRKQLVMHNGRRAHWLFSFRLPPQWHGLCTKENEHDDSVYVVEVHNGSRTIANKNDDSIHLVGDSNAVSWQRQFSSKQLNAKYR